MILKIVRFLNLLLVALTLGLTFCHVMEIPGKLRLSGAAWLTVQHNLYIARAGLDTEISGRWATPFTASCSRSASAAS